MYVKKKKNRSGTTSVVVAAGHGKANGGAQAHQKCFLMFHVVAKKKVETLCYSLPDKVVVFFF